MSQRMSLSMFTMYRAEGTSYVPALGETIIAFAIPAAAVLVYLFFAENLQLFGKQAESPEVEAPALASIKAGVFSGQNGIHSMVARRSGFAVFVIALALPALSLQSNAPPGSVTAATGWETLHIDGNRSGYVVNFPHLDHQERSADEVSQIANPTHTTCQVCHHLDMPEDEVSACWECHMDFNQPASIFDHSLHQSALGGNESCQQCHEGEHVKLTSEICQDCHENMIPAEGQADFNMQALSYKDAMHGRCLDCHEDQALEQDRPELALCSTCHTTYQYKLDQTYASATGK